MLSADPAVMEQAGGTVRIPEGASLDGILRSRTGQNVNDVMLRFRVASGGTATLTLNGAEQTVSAGEYDIRVVFDVDGCPFSLAAISGFVDILHAQNNLGFVISFR